MPDASPKSLLTRRQVKVPGEYLVDAALPSSSVGLTTISINHLSLGRREFEQTGPSIDTKLKTNQKSLEAAPVPRSWIVLQEFAKLFSIQVNPGCPESVRKSRGVSWTECLTKAPDSHANWWKLDLYSQGGEPTTREHDSRCQCYGKSRHRDLQRAVTRNRRRRQRVITQVRFEELV